MIIKSKAYRMCGTERGFHFHVSAPILWVVASHCIWWIPEPEHTKRDEALKLLKYVWQNTKVPDSYRGPLISVKSRGKQTFLSGGNKSSISRSFLNLCHFKTSTTVTSGDLLRKLLKCGSQSEVAVSWGPASAVLQHQKFTVTTQTQPSRGRQRRRTAS
jgi:hypothetical protein